MSEDEIIDPKKEQYKIEINVQTNKLIEKISNIFHGNIDQRISVLGAFDTWPYMDLVSRILADINYIAVTSIYIYRKINNNIIRMDIKENTQFVSKNYFMSELLDQIIGNCSSAIINYSISAAHFIETDWCFHRSKKTLGIAYVRNVCDFSQSICENLNIFTMPLGIYTECNIKKSERTIWDCMYYNLFCPFMRQDISKNVIEYFLRSQHMEIIAVDNLNIIKSIIKEKYPTLTDNEIKLSQDYKSIMSYDTLLINKNSIYILFIINKWSDLSWIERANNFKLINILQNTPGWDMETHDKSEMEKFIEENLIDNEYIKFLKNGYIDEDDLLDINQNTINMLYNAKFLNLKKIKIAELMTNMIKLTENGLLAISFYNELIEI